MLGHQNRNNDNQIIDQETNRVDDDHPLDYYRTFFKKTIFGLPDTNTIFETSIATTILADNYLKKILILDLDNQAIEALVTALQKQLKPEAAALVRYLGTQCRKNFQYFNQLYHNRNFTVVTPSTESINKQISQWQPCHLKNQLLFQASDVFNASFLIQLWHSQRFQTLLPKSEPLSLADHPLSLENLEDAAIENIIITNRSLIEDCIYGESTVRLDDVKQYLKKQGKQKSLALLSYLNDIAQSIKSLSQETLDDDNALQQAIKNFPIYQSPKIDASKENSITKPASELLDLAMVRSAHQAFYDLARDAFIEQCYETFVYPYDYEALKGNNIGTIKENIQLFSTQNNINLEDDHINLILGIRIHKWETFYENEINKCFKAAIADKTINFDAICFNCQGVIKRVFEKYAQQNDLSFKNLLTYYHHKRQCMEDDPMAWLNGLTQGDHLYLDTIRTFLYTLDSESKTSDSENDNDDSDSDVDDINRGYGLKNNNNNNSPDLSDDSFASDENRAGDEYMDSSDVEYTPKNQSPLKRNKSSSTLALNTKAKNNNTVRDEIDTYFDIFDDFINQVFKHFCHIADTKEQPSWKPIADFMNEKYKTLLTADECKLAYLNFLEIIPDKNTENRNVRFYEQKFLIYFIFNEHKAVHEKANDRVLARMARYNKIITNNNLLCFSHNTIENNPVMCSTYNRTINIARKRSLHQKLFSQFICINENVIEDDKAKTFKKNIISQLSSIFNDKNKLSLKKCHEVNPHGKPEQPSKKQSIKPASKSNINENHGELDPFSNNYELCQALITTVVTMQQKKAYDINHAFSWTQITATLNEAFKINLSTEQYEQAYKNILIGNINSSVKEKRLAFNELKLVTLVLVLKFKTMQVDTLINNMLVNKAFLYSSDSSAYHAHRPSSHVRSHSSSHKKYEAGRSINRALEQGKFFDDKSTTYVQAMVVFYGIISGLISGLIAKKIADPKLLDQCKAHVCKVMASGAKVLEKQTYVSNNNHARFFQQQPNKTASAMDTMNNSSNQPYSTGTYNLENFESEESDGENANANKRQKITPDADVPGNIIQVANKPSCP